MKQMKALSVLVFFLSLQNGVAQFTRLDQESNRRIDEIVENYLLNELVGVSIGLIKDGEIVFLKGYGYSNMEDSIKANECTLYRIGSVSKTITAVAALQLIEDKKLDYEDDVRKYVPEYPIKSQGPIKVIHLLRHNGCLERDGPSNKKYIDQNYYFNAIEAVKLFKDKPLLADCQIGSNQGRYSNIGYNLLGAVIERASGINYEDLIRTKISSPLNLPLLQPEYYWKSYSNYSIEYDANKNKIETNKGEVIMHLPSGGFISSVTDLTLFAKSLMKGRIFNSISTRDNMFFLKDLPYAESVIIRDKIYNLGIRKYGEDYFHNGNLSQSSTIIFISKNFRNAIVIMTNTGALNEDRLLTFSNYLNNLFQRIKVVDPYLYNEEKLPERILLSGIENDTENHAAKEIKATNYRLTLDANVKVQGEKILLQDGFKVEQGAHFLAKIKRANKGCW